MLDIFLNAVGTQVKLLNRLTTFVMSTISLAEIYLYIHRIWLKRRYNDMNTFLYETDASKP